MVIASNRVRFVFIADIIQESFSLMDIRQYFATVQAVIDTVPYAAVDAVVDALMQAAQSGNTVYIFGNGGSAATATHFGCDLAKRTNVDGFVQSNVSQRGGRKVWEELAVKRRDLVQRSKVHTGRTQWSVGWG